MSEQTITISQQLRQAIQNKYLNADPINELQLLKSQQDLLQSIKQLIEKRKYINAEILSINGLALNSNNSNILDQSLTSNPDHPSFQLSGFEEDFNNKSKLREQMETSAIGGVLRDVQEHCSDETYEIVRQSILANRLKDSMNFQKMTAKLIAERDELASQILILKMEKANSDKEIQRYKKIVAGIEDQKRNIRKKIDYVLKKENQVFKLQASFAFKQKISLELKKRYERLVGSFITNQAKIQKMYDELYKIWNTICNKVESIQCQGNCWRKDAMRKAKQQLMEERKLIKQQSSHLERQYEVMSIVSQHFKRIFQQPEKNNSAEKSSLKTEENEQGSRSFIKYQ